MWTRRAATPHSFPKKVRKAKFRHAVCYFQKAPCCNWGLTLPRDQKINQKFRALLSETERMVGGNVLDYAATIGDPTCCATIKQQYNLLKMLIKSKLIQDVHYSKA